MTKADLTRRLAEKTGLPSKDARVAVETVIETIAESLSSWERVEFPGFGRFYVVHRDTRVGRNPKTGESVAIRAGRYVRFAPSPVALERLNAENSKRQE